MQPSGQHKGNKWWYPAIRDALKAVEGMTDREAAKVLGFSYSTINRYRRAMEEGKPIKEPRGAPRAVLQRFTGGSGAKPDSGAIDPIRELRRRMDAIDARTDLTPAQREIAKDIELQMHRQGVLEYEARIADRRMRALERVFDLAAGRPTTAGQGVPVEVTLEAFENTVRAGVRAEFEEEARRRAANRE